MLLVYKKPGCQQSDPYPKTHSLSSVLSCLFSILVVKNKIKQQVIQVSLFVFLLYSFNFISFNVTLIVQFFNYLLSIILFYSCHLFYVFLIMPILSAIYRVSQCHSVFYIVHSFKRQMISKFKFWRFAIYFSTCQQLRFALWIFRNMKRILLSKNHKKNHRFCFPRTCRKQINKLLYNFQSYNCLERQIIRSSKVFLKIRLLLSSR